MARASKRCMELKLNREEHAYLQQVLNTMLGELRVEVRHTRDSEDKAHFKQREKVLRDILGKLATES